MAIAVLVVLLVLLVPLNLWASFVAWFDEFALRDQRIAQLLLVWCLPLLGALLVLAIPRHKLERARSGMEVPDAGDDQGASARNVRAITEALDGD